MEGSNAPQKLKCMYLCRLEAYCGCCAFAITPVYCLQLTCFFLSCVRVFVFPSSLRLACFVSPLFFPPLLCLFSIPPPVVDVMCSWYLLLIISWHPALAKTGSQKNLDLTRTTEGGAGCGSRSRAVPPPSFLLAFRHTKTVEVSFLFCLCFDRINTFDGCVSIFAPKDGEGKGY